MKKIDFHIHTIAVEKKDAPFNFDLSKFQEYISNLSIDAIAITNHNIFDLEQFKEISDSLKNVIVFPGIEIDLESGHILLISDNNDLEDFKQKCDEISKLIVDETSSISLDDFKKTFTDLDKYILIPHDKKDPRMKDEALKQLSEHISAGEVASRKKFIYSLKETEDLVPVLFSDARISDKVVEFPVRQTFIDVDEVSFASIKSCLQDKNKVSLSPACGHEFVEIFSNGQVISTKLNVILGKSERYPFLKTTFLRYYHLENNYGKTRI